MRSVHHTSVDKGIALRFALSLSLRFLCELSHYSRKTRVTLSIKRRCLLPIRRRTGMSARNGGRTFLSATALR